MLPFSQHSAATDYRLGIGGYYSSGDYGADEETVIKDTVIYSIPVSIQARHWPWQIKISTSYLQLESNEVSDRNNIRPDTSKRTEYGIGDTVLTLSHSWLSKTNKPVYSAAWFKIKFPTADDSKDLGSGEFDVEPGITLSHLADWSPFIKLGFRWRGDSDETNYSHQWKTAIGISHKTDNRWQFSGFLSSKHASTARGQTNTSAYLSCRYQLSTAIMLTPYVSYGLSDGSPDFALGWNLNIRLFSEN